MGFWSRRQVLRGGAAASAAMALRGYAAGVLPEAGAEGGLRQSLNGAAWTLHEEDVAESYPAVVPGCTFLDLMRAGKIPDPYRRENEGVTSWVAERNWVYERSFEVSDALRNAAHVELVCEGLDTIATLWMNGERLGSAENMFRTWRYDVKHRLRPGKNSLRIRFEALTPYVKQRAWAAGLKWYGIFHSWPEPAYVRKAGYMWGWDFACRLLTQGIWKPIALQGYSARLTDLNVEQTHQPDGSVGLAIQTEAGGEVAGTRVVTQVALGDTVIAKHSDAVMEGKALRQVQVAKPQLWWPNGFGEQPLYQVTMELVDGSGKVLDRVSRRIGLRKIEVFAEADGVSKHVRVNGVPVFLKGANWVAADSLPTQVTSENLQWYVQKAKECNFNFIRLHGAEYYEEDAFFDACDEAGILLQFEFKFANTVYPTKDREWMENVLAEVEEQTRRCRNHAAIAIWSGNNEVRKFDGYEALFTDLIGGTVQRLVPGAYYETGSGGGVGVKLEEVREGERVAIRMSGSGDVHACRIWHLDAPLETYHDVQGFLAEVGIQAFPVPRSVRTYTDAADRKSINSPAMCYHERDGSGDGYGVIDYYDSLYFGRAPERFDDVLWLSQVTQAWGLRYGIEFWRRSRPRSMAAVIWQFNDCWPGVTWSLVDYYRRCKAAQYQAKHFFAPVLVSGTPDAQSGQAELHVTNDQRHAVAGELRWVVTGLDGKTLEQGSSAVQVEACSSQMAHALDLSAQVKKHGAPELLIWVELVSGGQVVAQNLLFFGRPVERKLARPRLKMNVSGQGTEYQVQLETDVPALWVWLEVEHQDASYSDNFLHLRPGRGEVVRVSLEKPLSPQALRESLKVRSIFDVAPEMRQAGTV